MFILDMSWKNRFRYRINLTKIVIIFDAHTPIFTIFYSPKLVNYENRAIKVRHFHENIFDSVLYGPGPNIFMYRTTV